MNNSRGFGLIGILIALVIVVGIAGTSFYTLQNIREVDTLDGENEKQSIDSAIQQAEEVKQQVEKIQTVDNEKLLQQAEEVKQQVEKVQIVDNEKLLQDCLLRAQNNIAPPSREQICEDLGLSLDEFGNCDVGIDFVQTETTSPEDCHLKYPLD